MSVISPANINGEFDKELKDGVYRAIYGRRDIRAQFRGDPIPEDVLARIIHAAHHAPSVGFMQPWNFILIREQETRRKIHAAFERATAEAAMKFSGEKRERYKTFKLEGILESPLNICITRDLSASGRWSSGGRPARLWTSIAAFARSRTCGWLPGQRGWEWGG